MNKEEAIATSEAILKKYLEEGDTVAVHRLHINFYCNTIDEFGCTKCSLNKHEDQDICLKLIRSPTRYQAYGCGDVPY